MGIRKGKNKGIKTAERPKQPQYKKKASARAKRLAALDQSTK